MKEITVYKKRWWTLAVLIVGLLVIGFDTTILTVALPVLTTELNASTTDLQWIMNIYVLFLAAFLLFAGAVGDRYGRKKLLIVGLLLFGITSVMAGLSTTTNMLIVARGFMGIAAAIMLPLTMSIVPTIFFHEERTKAIAIWAAGMGVGLLIGPLVGGFLLEHYAWQSIFYINLPIIAVTLIGVIFLVPESKDEQAAKLDWLGATLSGIGLLLVVYGITEGAEKGWASFHMIFPTIVGLIFIIIFILHQKFTKYPMLDLSLFQNKGFTWATVAGIVVMFVLSGLLFFVTQYMEFFFNLTPLETGVKLMPLIGAYVVGALMSNVIVKKIGTKYIVVIGLVILSIGLLMMSQFDAASSYKSLALSFIIQGFGMGLMMSPAMDAVMASLPLGEVGIGSAVNNALRQVGGTLGIALLGSVISFQYEKDLSQTLGKLYGEQLIEPIQQSIGAAKHIALNLEFPLQEHVLLHAGNAFLKGMELALFISVGFILIGIVTTLLFLPSFQEKKRM